MYTYFWPTPTREERGREAVEVGERGNARKTPHKCACARARQRQSKRESNNREIETEKKSERKGEREYVSE